MLKRLVSRLYDLVVGQNYNAMTCECGAIAIRVVSKHPPNPSEQYSLRVAAVKACEKCSRA